MTWKTLATSLATALGALWIGAAQALVLDLNCVISNGACTPSASYGQITIITIAAGVEVEVDLPPGPPCSGCLCCFDVGNLTI
jgi:hypothetical protein